MQMITDFFKMLSQLFTVASKTVTPIEMLVDQTAANLYASKMAAEIKAVKDTKELMANGGVTQDEIDALRKDIWG